MATKLEYLKLAALNNKFENKSWFISCFAIPVLKQNDTWENTPGLYNIVTQPDGLYYVDSKDPEIKTDLNNRQLIKITDHKKGEPLFKFNDLIDVDNTWNQYIKSKIQTRLGVFIINALILLPVFKGKLEYINDAITIDKIESMLVQRVVNDDVAKPTDITVSEMIQCFDRFNFLTNLANIVNIAASYKIITPPDGIDAIRAKLLKEYDGQLHDPVKLVELENKLREVDNEYLSDDVAAKHVLNGKTKKARTKMYLIVGDTLDFKKSVETDPVTQSLLDGISSSEKDFPKYMNDQRVGSFARGASTQLGGYTYKILQRSLSNIVISPVPCDTKRGLKRLITDSTTNKLLNRYILSGGKWVLIDTVTESKKYANKTVEMRSAMYCISPKNTICYKCLSEVYKDTPAGVTNMASDLSAVLLSLFMQLTHGIVRESVVINIDDLVS